MALSRQIIRDSKSPEKLAKWARSSKPWVRAEVAANSAAPPDALHLLAKDQYADVLFALAGNPSLPESAFAGVANRAYYNWLKVISYISADDICKKLCHNPSISIDLLKSLAEDETCNCRWLAVQAMRARKGMALPSEVGWSCYDVAAYAVKDWSNGLWPCLSECQRVCIAANDTAPAEYLNRLAGDSKEKVRIMVAGNIATPPEVLARLAADAQDLVRGRVAQNPSAPLDVLAVLAEDLDPGVRSAALERLRERRPKNAQKH
jgi:hypothetical protein